MLKHLEEVLTATGLPADQVKALVELPEDSKDFKPDTYVATVRGTVETAVKNDPNFYTGLDRKNIPETFMKTLEAEQYGRSAAEVRGHLLKAFGWKEEDFKELGDEFKKIPVFSKAFAEKIASGKVTDKELQQKLIEANTEIERLKGAEPDLEKKYQGIADARVAEFQFGTAVITHLASVPGLKAPAKYLATDIGNTLKSMYAIVVENGVVELRQKDKPTLKVTTDNGTKVLTLGAAIDAIVKQDNLADPKSTKTEKDTVKVEVDGEKGKLKVSSHVNDKMKARIEQDKKAAGSAS